MEQLFHEFVPPGLGMHYLVKIEVNDFHFIQFGSHGMRHHTKYCDIFRSCRSLIETFLDGSQSFQSSGRVGSALDLNGHFRNPGVRLFVVFLEGMSGSEP